ncbi:MAG TPA: cation-translocating P-type ATPase [Ramlibacter sp.]|uniref:heavy metal translocating P-type ATPase n=1 Tax=Ramlibacter sp. TaxID=1917967 RepID=UPI002C7FC5BF|nr:cation-translocating P-type ATPase [Ramlibacter sp.]HVZ43416.1 cation-translocating P-type ATPase [Ramlibacter sp.]
MEAALGTFAIDDPAEWEAFSRPLAREGAQRWESYLAIGGMYCPACSLAVEEALMKTPGVESVQVNGSTATARVVWTPGRAKPSAWLAALRKAGYDAVPAGDQIAEAPRRLARRMLLWRWLVAGFCMMQVMMYTVPAYLAGPGEMTDDASALLRWASWILTLPVLLFSAKPFFASAWRDVRNGTIGMDVPVSLGLAIAFAASSASTFDPQGPLGRDVWYDSVTMFVFFLLSGRLLGERLREKTAGALQALMRALPATVERAVGEADASGESRFESVPVRRLRAGDRIRIRAGEVVPADGRVLEGASRVDEALLTGESNPVMRSRGEAVVAGSHNLSATLLVEVERTGPDTRFGEIVALMERASTDKPRIAQLADRAARPFLGAVMLAAVAAAGWWWPHGPGVAIGVAIAVLIVTCPCALSLATPAAALASAGALARRGVLVRRLEALEDGANVDTIVFDKTGTLTQDRMVLTGVRTREGVAPDEALRMAAALAQHSLHPASRAIANAAGEVGWNAVNVTQTPGVGVEGEVRGDSGWLPRRLRLGAWQDPSSPRPPLHPSSPRTPLHPSSARTPLHPSFPRTRESSDFSPPTQTHLFDDQGWLATFDLDESLKPDARASIGELTRMGRRVEMLSGDRAAPAERLAWRAGIEHALAVQTPEAKLAHIATLQSQGHRVAMVGDGMNDGPVLARADLSIAMGQGVPVAQAQSDVVILGGQLDRVALVLKQSMRTRSVVRQNLLWAAGYNAICVPLAIMGYLPPWLAGLGMAASSLVVVANSARLALIR